MIIEKIEIISFGKFSNKVIDFSHGLNIIFGNNESGKTTIINFIYSMLYGFGDNRGKILSLREKYTPWNGGLCEGKMIFLTDDGKKLCIYRKAGNAKKYDILRIYDADTGEEYHKTPEEIIGVGQDTFFKTLCVKQLSTAFNGSNEEIIQKLSNITTGGDEAVNYEKALKILENKRREIQPQRGQGGQLAIITNKISEAEKTRLKKSTIKAELASVDSLLSEEESKVKKLKKEYNNLDNSDYYFEIARLQGRVEEMKRQTSVKSNTPFLLSAITALMLFICAVFFKFNYGYLFLPVSLVLFIQAFVRRNSSPDENLKKAENEITILIEKQNEKDEKIRKIKKALSEAELKFENLKIRRESLSLSLSEESEDTALLTEKKKELEFKLRTINICTEALKQAYENMQKNFTPLLSKKASLYFSQISGGKYSQIFCDKEFGIMINTGLPRESVFFSGGTVDQLYLSLRLALIDMIFEDSTCPLILDQPFLQYDSTRKERTIQLLKNLPSCRQVFLFTSDENIKSVNKTTEILT